MKFLPNIEPSAFRRGEYVGYCNGAQRIRKAGNGWQTVALVSSAGKFVPMYARTLTELSAICADLLRSNLPKDHPAYFVAVGQFESAPREVSK